MVPCRKLPGKTRSVINCLFFAQKKLLNKRAIIAVNRDIMQQDRRP